MKVNYKALGTKFIIGFSGTTLTDDLKKLYQIFPFGGILLLKKNIQSPEQLFHLIQDFQNLSPDIPLFISIDHEGGRVQRLDEPFTQIPKAEFYGLDFEKTKSLEEIRKITNIIARELLAVGINLNFSPVLDINTNKNNPIIGDRAFSENPEIVSILSVAMISEFNRLGLLCCGKHFPGHGETRSDSHLTLPSLPFDEKRLLEIELIPFISAIKASVPMIMTGHLKFDKIDPKFPVTISEYFIQNILREKLKFDGLIVSDDMEMKAIKDNYTIDEWVFYSTQASIDLIIVSKDTDVQYNSFCTLVKLYESGKIGRNLIDKSADAIMKVRDKIKITAKLCLKNSFGF